MPETVDRFDSRLAGGVTDEMDVVTENGQCASRFVGDTARAVEALVGPVGREDADSQLLSASALSRSQMRYIGTWTAQSSDPAGSGTAAGVRRSTSNVRHHDSQG